MKVREPKFIHRPATYKSRWGHNSGVSLLLLTGIERISCMDQFNYYEKCGSGLSRDSEHPFIDESLYLLVRAKIEHVISKYPFWDQIVKSRQIDLVIGGALATRDEL
jgi:hypothetical protein